MKQKCLTLAFIICVLGCRKPYNPPAIGGTNGYLVVEGVINPGSDSTIVKLSRTVNISGNLTAKLVSGAIVSVVSDQNTSFSLTETSGGNYVSAGLNLDNTHQYRLNVKTSDGRQYQSDYVPVVITPPIDSVGYNLVTKPDTGVEIYVNTHDPSNSIHYFRWDYVENWEFSAKYTSYFISNGSGLLIRTQDQNITICYTGDVSSDIVLGTSAKLRQDVISQNPISFIRYTSEKIEDRYAILLRQYALTSEAYTFWVNLKKNTEQLGSIFDAEPSETPGNIHCITNAAEPVIGYFSISTVASKRVFIYNSNLPAWVPIYPYACRQDTVHPRSPNFYSTVIANPDIFIATGALGSFMNPSAYYYTDRQCGDCTIRGSRLPPPFWK